MGAPKRREIGHGALAERALLPGAARLRGRFPLRHPRGLRGAGVQRLLLHGLHLRKLPGPAWTPACPSPRPVSGVAMGLIKEGDDVVILSDIQGIEDFLGRHGLQGAAVPPTASPPCRWTTRPRASPWTSWPAPCKQAKEGRAFILDAMLETIDGRACRADARPRRASRPSRSPWTRSATSSVPAARWSAASRRRPAPPSTFRRTAPSTSAPSPSTAVRGGQGHDPRAL